MNTEILNRFDNSVIYSMDFAEDDPRSKSEKLGATVVQTIKNGVNLLGADLLGADLSDTNLSGANLSHVDLSEADLSHVVLSGANLSHVDLSHVVLSGTNLLGTNLSEADLSEADLRTFKACLWTTLTENATEVPGLVDSLQAGRVDGSKYEGDCVCLVGTIAKVKGVSHTDLKPDSRNPSEQWFLMISKGDKPTDNTGGGFAARKVLEWIEEWQSHRRSC